MNPPRSHRQHARAKMAGTGTVVRRVADDNELFRLKFDTKVLTNSFRGKRR